MSCLPDAINRRLAEEEAGLFVGLGLTPLQQWRQFI